MQSIGSFTIRCVSFLYEHIILYFILLTFNIVLSVLLMDLINAVPTTEGAIESFKLLSGYYFGNTEAFWQTFFLSLLNGTIWLLLSMVPIALAITSGEHYNHWLRITFSIIGLAFFITSLYFIGHALTLFGTLLIIGGLAWLAIKALSD